MPAAPWPSGSPDGTSFPPLSTATSGPLAMAIPLPISASAPPRASTAGVLILMLPPIPRFAGGGVSERRPGPLDRDHALDLGDHAPELGLDAERQRGGRHRAAAAGAEHVQVDEAVVEVDELDV